MMSTMLTGLLLLQLLTFSTILSVKQDYSLILEKWSTDEKLGLLQASSLVKHYRNLSKDVKESVNRTCAKDFAAYGRALIRREPWAVRSKFFF